MYSVPNCIAVGQSKQYPIPIHEVVNSLNSTCSSRQRKTLTIERDTTGTKDPQLTADSLRAETIASFRPSYPRDLLLFMIISGFSSPLHQHPYVPFASNPSYYLKDFLGRERDCSLMWGSAIQKLGVSHIPFIILSLLLSSVIFYLIKTYK